MDDDKIEVELKDEGKPGERAEAKVVATVEEPVESLPIVGFLGVADASSSNNQEMLGFIWGCLGEEKTVADKLQKLQSIESRLSTPTLGESRLSKVYNFLRAQKAADEAEKARNAYLR